MISWSSRAARFVPVAAVVLLCAVWAFIYWDLPVDPRTLHTPWSHPEASVEDESDSGSSDISHGWQSAAGGIKDIFFKHYPSTASYAAEVVQHTGPSPSPTGQSPSSTFPGLIGLTQAVATYMAISSAPSTSTASSDSSPPSDVPLILYAYFETSDTRPNIEFFVTHGLHANAKFLFILNGATNAETLLPTDRPNIHFVKRANRCFDVGAYAEVLRADDSALLKQHRRFIMINASLRGPFVPFWSTECWSDAYLGRLTDRVKLVGMTMNCRPDLPRHVQSMILATDRAGMDVLLTPEGIETCPQSWQDAVDVELRLTDLIKRHGYTVRVMSAEANSYAGFEDVCVGQDITVQNAYGGMNLHPYETMFVKTKRGADPLTLELLTKFHDGSNYSSYDVC